MLILLHALVALLYAAAAWASWPRASHAKPHAAARGLVAVAILAHMAVIAVAIATPDGLDLSFANALSLVAGLVALVAWASGLFSLLPATTALVLPVAAGCALLPALAQTPHRFPYADEPWAALHIGVALVAYALLVVAALQALVLVGLEKRLHRGAPNLADGATPPLLTLERFLFRLIVAGFVLLTATLVSGFLFSEQLFGKPVTFTHKNVLSLAGWLVFAVLLFGRWRYGWRGRKAVRWIVGGTVLLLLGYLGSKFVIEVLLKR
jgi:ABC-type uncharacterized transport system permease subunit